MIWSTRWTAVIFRFQPVPMKSPNPCYQRRQRLLRENKGSRDRTRPLCRSLHGCKVPRSNPLKSTCDDRLFCAHPSTASLRHLRNRHCSWRFTTRDENYTALLLPSILHGWRVFDLSVRVIVSCLIVSPRLAIYRRSDIETSRDPRPPRSLGASQQMTIRLALPRKVSDDWGA